MNEIIITDKWITSLIKNDPVLVGLLHGRVFADKAPLGTSAFPFVVFQMYNPRPDKENISNKSNRIWVEMDYMVKAIDKSEDYTLIGDVMERIDDLMQGFDGIVEGGEIISCTGRFPIKYPEATDGVNYRHLGRIYRIAVKKN